MKSCKAALHYQTIGGKKDRIARHVMREKLGRDLESDEHVYHLNGDSKDNSEENLIVIKKNLRNSR
jgi:hypothetical protein